ncbi:MAG: alkaline phosphatase family protein [Dokdonella sp.]
MSGKVTKILSFAFAAVLMAGCTVITSTPRDASGTGIFVRPEGAKVVLVMLENGSPEQANSAANPFLQRLASSGAYFDRYYAVAHPSQPNYVALISGMKADAVSGDRKITFPADTPFLGDNRSQHRPSWKLYAEDYPGDKDNCYTEKGYRPPGSKKDTYSRKHVPYMSFKQVQEVECKTSIVGFSQFERDTRNRTLSDFSLVIPNLLHDAHDHDSGVKNSVPNLSQADSWLNDNFSPMLVDEWFQKNAILIVTFDENDASFPYQDKTGNRVYLAMSGAHVKPGIVHHVYDHYDLLRTIEEIFNVLPLNPSGGDGQARVIGDVFQ